MYFQTAMGQCVPLFIPLTSTPIIIFCSLIILDLNCINWGQICPSFRLQARLAKLDRKSNIAISLIKVYTKLFAYILKED